MARVTLASLAAQLEAYKAESDKRFEKLADLADPNYVALERKARKKARKEARSLRDRLLTAILSGRLSKEEAVDFYRKVYGGVL